MSLAGHAFPALWNDIAPSRGPEYDQCHTLEHVPERVGVTGFYGSRRHVNRSRQHHRYFTRMLMIAERASDLILGQESVGQAETAEALP